MLQNSAWCTAIIRDGFAPEAQYFPAADRWHESGAPLQFGAQIVPVNSFTRIAPLLGQLLDTRSCPERKAYIFWSSRHKRLFIRV
jgi:hypothetical protein